MKLFAEDAWLLKTGEAQNSSKMSDSDDYNESVVMVDPNDIEIPSEPEDDELTIDCDYEINKDGYDPMSLVSIIRVSWEEYRIPMDRIVLGSDLTFILFGR